MKGNHQQQRRKRRTASTGSMGDCGIVQPSDGKLGQASLTDRPSNGCRREPDHGLEPPGPHPETRRHGLDGSQRQHSRVLGQLRWNVRGFRRNSSENEGDELHEDNLVAKTRGGEGGHAQKAWPEPEDPKLEIGGEAELDQPAGLACGIAGQMDRHHLLHGRWPCHRKHTRRRDQNMVNQSAADLRHAMSGETRPRLASRRASPEQWKSSTGGTEALLQARLRRNPKSIRRCRAPSLISTASSSEMRSRPRYTM